MIRLAVRVADEEALAGLRAGRSGLNRAVKGGLFEAARIAVPSAKSIVHTHSGRTAGAIHAGATTRSGFLEVKLGKQAAPWFGLLEFGGTLRAIIRPREKKALAFGGQVVARVTTPRTYQGQHILERGIEAKRRPIERAVLEAAVTPFERYFQVL